LGGEALDLERVERTDRGGRPTEPRGDATESRVRGRRNGEGKAEVRSCGREHGRSGRWRGEWRSFRDPAGPLVGAGGRRGSACGSAGRTPKGQNHGVERYPYAFFRGRDKYQPATGRYDQVLSPLRLCLRFLVRSLWQRIVRRFSGRHARLSFAKSPLPFPPHPAPCFVHSHPLC
jgi:hypothetical protein